MAQKNVKDLKVYNIHAGHNPDGKVACGAVGILKESTEARNIVGKVEAMLKILGKTVYNCTCNNGTSQNDVLKKIVAKCNAHNVDIDISVHLNSGRDDKKGDGKTGGVEVWLYPDSTLADIAEDVCKYISEELGIKNRGVKYSSGLYVLKNTKASAMLIEICFVDDMDDAEKYDDTKAAEAIVHAVSGTKYKYGVEQESAESAGSTETENEAGSKTENKQNSSVFSPYVVRVICDTLNVRSGPSDKCKVVTKIKKGDAYTIIKEENGWGKLKSGVGWICLKYTERIKKN